MEWLDNLSYWHWLVLGTLLLAADILGMPGLLIGLAMGAYLVAGLVFAEMLLNWQGMLITFALSGLILTLLFTRLFKRYNDKTDAPDLNNFSAQMIDTEFSVTEDYAAGKHRIKINDTVWECMLENSVQAGDKLKVSGYQGNVLQLVPSQY